MARNPSRSTDQAPDAGADATTTAAAPTDGAAAATAADPGSTPDGSGGVDGTDATAPAPAGEPAPTTAAAPATAPDATPAVVRPKQYSDPKWAVGAPAPAARYRVYDDAGVLGPVRAKELQPGERGVIVIQEGDTVTAAVRRELGAE